MDVKGNCSIEGHCIVDNHKIVFNSKDCQEYSHENIKSKEEEKAKDVSNFSKEPKSPIVKPNPSATVESFWTKKLQVDEYGKGKAMNRFTNSDLSCR